MKRVEISVFAEKGLIHNQKSCRKKEREKKETRTEETKQGKNERNKQEEVKVTITQPFCIKKKKTSMIDR